MVQLKVKTALANDTTVQGFQFQYGTIKRINTYPLTEAILQFQFQYGTIKSLFFSMTFIKALCFNSNMVQLKARVGSMGTSAMRKFQFQYGTIKRILGRLRQMGLYLFQFQYGTIKRRTRRLGVY